MVRGSKPPHRYMLPAAALGMVVGWMAAARFEWDPLFTAIGVGLLAQVVVEALWSGRDRE